MFFVDYILYSYQWEGDWAFIQCKEQAERGTQTSMISKFEKLF